MTMLIVRRGLSHSYMSFLRVYARNRGLELTVDRRTDERRQRQVDALPDRRQADRRGPPPHTWDLADFVAIEPPDKSPDTP